MADQLFNIAEYANLTKEEQMLYDQDLKHKCDNENVLAYVEKRGLEKGREKGREEGLEKGIEQVARELKKMGMPLNQINVATKMPVEKIAKF